LSRLLSQPHSSSSRLMWRQSKPAHYWT